MFANPTIGFCNNTPTTRTTKIAKENICLFLSPARSPCGLFDVEIFEKSSHLGESSTVVRKQDSGACKWHNYIITISRELARVYTDNVVNERNAKCSARMASAADRYSNTIGFSPRSDYLPTSCTIVIGSWSRSSARARSPVARLEWYHCGVKEWVISYWH